MERLLHSNSVPSEAQVAEIHRSIKEKEADLERFQGEIDSTNIALSSLLNARDQLIKIEEEWTTAEASQDTDVFFDVLEEHSELTLDRLNADIEAHKAALLQLASKREATTIAIEDQKSVLSPIRRVPVEVLVEIFLRCLPDDHFVKPSTQSAPLLLTQICQNWRHLSLSIGRLWASISVEINKERCSPHPLLIASWLARSGALPLSFQLIDRLTLEDVTQHQPPFTAPPIIARFIPYLNRWHTVHLDFSDWRVNTGLDALIAGGPPPLLESLSIWRDFWIKEDSNSLRVLLSAPRLHDLTWAARHSQLDPMAIVVLSKMTSIRIEYFVPLDNFYTVLKHSPSLLTCRFSVHKESPVLDTLPIIVPQLRSLDLSVGGSLDTVFQKFTAPSLTQLRISKALVFPALAGERFWYANQVSSFISASVSGIKHLEFLNVDITSSELIDLLKQLSSSLNHLTVSDDGSRYPVNDEVLQALTRQIDEADNLCPNLEYLKLWGCIQSTDGLLADMVQSRWNPSVLSTTIKRLEMVFVMLRPLADYAEDVGRLKRLNDSRLGSITIM